ERSQTRDPSLVGLQRWPIAAGGKSDGPRPVLARLPRRSCGGVAELRSAASCDETRDPRQRQVQREIDRQADDEQREDVAAAEEVPVVADLAGELRIADDVGERGVLQEYDELRKDDRKHLPEGLRKLDQAPGLDRAEAEREPRLPLPTRKRGDAGAERFADDRTVVDGETKHARPVRSSGEDEEYEEDHEQQRYSPHEFQDDTGHDA